MPAFICYKPKGSCPTCQHYRHDPERNAKACFAHADAQKKHRKGVSTNVEYVSH